MIREKFPIQSDLLELLLAFEKAGNLETLAGMMAKDPSVISRRLKELASLAPVLVKVGGRWQMTAYGRELNALSRPYLKTLNELLPLDSWNGKSVVPEKSLLIVINGQKVLHYTSQRRRSNLQAEHNILRLLKYWRVRKWPVLHVKHVSDKNGSLFDRKSSGVEFMEGFEPRAKEPVIEKTKSSAFVKTDLERMIHHHRVPAIVLVGFTAGECIDATARNASDLDIRTFVIGDATATFEIVDANGKLVKAEKVHKNTMAHLHAHFADVIHTDSVVP